MKMSLRNLLFIAVFGGAALIGCGSGVQGTYSDPSGGFVLDLKSGGNATFTFAGQAASCTYKVDGKQLTLTCQGDTSPTVLTIQNDGSLTGPPGTMMPPLRKK